MLALLLNIVLTIVPWLCVLTLVVVVHEMGHFLVAKACGVKIDCFSLGFGKTLFSRRDRSGVEWRIAALPLGGYVRFSGDADASSSVPDADDLEDLKRQIVARQGAGAVSQYFHFKPLWQRAAVVAAGPAANFILAIAIFSVLLMTVGQNVIRPRIAQVVAGSAAERAGFKAGDIITAMNGRPIDNFLLISSYAAFNPGRLTAFVVERGAGTVSLNAAPEPKTRPDPMFGRPMRMGTLGLVPTRDPADYSKRRLDPLSAVVEGARETGENVSITVRYMGRILAGRESGDQLGGPIRMALASKTMTQSAVAAGHTPGEKSLNVILGLVSFAAIISIGLGFMNLLPIPMLDGGHLLFYGYEALARRPVTAGFQAISYRVGLALVVGLMLFATWNDLQLPVLQILGGHVS
jgi:regulator of sigma E protease